LLKGMGLRRDKRTKCHLLPTSAEIAKDRLSSQKKGGGKKGLGRKKRYRGKSFVRKTLLLAPAEAERSKIGQKKKGNGFRVLINRAGKNGREEKGETSIFVSQGSVLYRAIKL